MDFDVLIVDDSPFMRLSLSNIFKKSSNIREIFQAANGVEALEMYKNKRPELVTMDIDMPVMNGLDSANEIKSFDPKAKIVMVTSTDNTELREKVNKIGTIGYITKPFDPKRIHEIIEKIS